MFEAGISIGTLFPAPSALVASITRCDTERAIRVSTMGSENLTFVERKVHGVEMMGLFPHHGDTTLKFSGLSLVREL